MKIVIAITLCISITCFSIVYSNQSINPQKMEELTIGTAASLNDVMCELIMDFQRKNKTVKVEMTCNATGIIRNQIMMNAPIDVFISANDTFGGTPANVGQIVDKDSIKVMCYNSLVLIGNIKDFEENCNIGELLEKHNSQIAIGNPEYVPAGEYARHLLEEKSLLDKNIDRLIYANNVRQVLAWVELGVVRNGFVYKTDALKSRKIKHLEEFEYIGEKKITYSMALTKNVDNVYAAKLFLRYMQSSDASEILNRHGFITNTQ